jgi:hypothetical protein
MTSCGSSSQQKFEHPKDELVMVGFSGSLDQTVWIFESRGLKLSILANLKSRVSQWFAQHFWTTSRAFQRAAPSKQSESMERRSSLILGQVYLSGRSSNLIDLLRACSRLLVVDKHG